MTRRIRCRTIDRSVLRPSRSKDAEPKKAALRPHQGINQTHVEFWARQSASCADADHTTKTADSTSSTGDINERHRRFWAQRTRR